MHICRHWKAYYATENMHQSPILTASHGSALTSLMDMPRVEAYDRKLRGFPGALIPTESFPAVYPLRERVVCNFTQPEPTSILSIHPE